MTADGRVFHSGGRVVKNVAGYDLCKLLVGSAGTLAIVTQLTLKLKPLPESSLLIGMSFEKLADLDSAVAQVLNSQTRPVAIEILNPAAAELIEGEAQVGLPVNSFLLIVGYEGARQETDWQAETLRSEFSDRPKEFSVVPHESAGRLWSALTEFGVCNDAAFAFQANLLPSKVAPFVDQASQSGVAILSHAADGTVIGKAAGTDNEMPRAEQVTASLSELARRSGGYLVLLRGDRTAMTAAPAATSPVSAQSLMRDLKRAFDPQNLLNPGRLFPAQ
jgi:glycolate oxidase FAD binding subunit